MNKKWSDKISHRVRKYGGTWERYVAERERRGLPLPSKANIREVGYEDGAIWMLSAFVHLIRSKKNKCDKMYHNTEDEDEKHMLALVSAVYSGLITDLMKDV